jgi:hypothetical protein
MSRPLIVQDDVQHPGYGAGEVLDRFQDSDGRELVVVKFPHPPGMAHTDRAQIVPVLIMPVGMVQV